MLIGHARREGQKFGRDVEAKLTNLDELWIHEAGCVRVMLYEPGFTKDL